MKPFDLCMQLVKADSEAKVIAILKRAGYWDDLTAWTDYGYNENNWSIIGNQQGQADAALVEKLVNASDSVLMDRCQREGLDPAGGKRKVPKSIKEALARYFNLGKNHLADLTSQQRTTLAESTCGLVATGSAKRPCYAVFDFGEGQNGDDFFETFLSLAKSNKLTVPFVQGKFNQGSTGALRFCGKLGLQLILSKRDPALVDADGNWSFTVTRRFEPDEASRRRSSVIRCLNPGGRILTFGAKALHILPTRDGPNGREMTFGTYIKLYEYLIPGHSTNLVFNLNYRLSALLVEPILPVRLYETRSDSYQGHTLEATMNGLELRLLEDPSQNIESGFPVGGALRTAAGEFRYRIFAFKKGANARSYGGSDGVLFTINGQTHGSFPRNFFQRKSVGMDYLARSLIMVVDCSALSANSVEQIFMPSRDRLTGGPLTKELEQVLMEIIHDNADLQRLRESRRNEELRTKIGDNKQVQLIFNKIVKESPDLSRLLSIGEQILNPYLSQKTEHEGKESFTPSYSPTFLSVLRPYSKLTPHRVEAGKSGRIALGTDAPNDYLARPRDRGTFTLACENNHPLKWRINAHDGAWTLHLAIPEDFPVGKPIAMTCTLGDDTMPAPLAETFWIQAQHFIFQEPEPATSKPRESSRKKKENPNEGKGKKGPPPGLATPNIVEVREPQWNEHDFNERSAMKVVSGGNGAYDFFVNMDNIHLINEIRAAKTDKIILENRFKLFLVVTGVVLLADDNDDSDVPDNSSSAPETQGKTDMVRWYSERVAQVLLPMLNELASDELSELDSSAESL